MGCAVEEEARLTLSKALELFFEVADASEIAERRGGEIFVTSVEVSVLLAAAERSKIMGPAWTRGKSRLILRAR